MPARFNLVHLLVLQNTLDGTFFHIFQHSLWISSFAPHSPRHQPQINTLQGFSSCFVVVVGEEKKRLLSLFIPPHCSVSSSCNLFCRFLHHHYSRCSFMSDSDGEGDRRNPRVTSDGNVRITQLGNSETLMKLFYVSGWGFWTRSQSK